MRPGDWITLPVGPDQAHQLINDGERTLRYLCLSTLIATDVVGYPDSRKIGFIAADSVESSARGAWWLRRVIREGESVDYWDGEDVG